MAVKYFNVKEDLLNPKKIDELREVIASRNMRVNNELSFLNAVYALDYAKNSMDDKEFRKTKKAYMQQIKQCLDYIPVEEQIDGQFESILLSDEGQRLLAFIYNTLTGNYTLPYNPRQVSTRMHCIGITASDKELTQATGLTDEERIKRALFDLMDVLRISYEYGDGDHVSMNLITALEHTTDNNGMGVYEIGVDRAMIHLLPRYIKKLVKEEYIEPLPLVDLLDHFGHDSEEERRRKLQEVSFDIKPKEMKNPVCTDDLWDDLNIDMGYWYFTDELAKPLDVDDDGFLAELEFKEGCGLHPITIATDSTKITYRSNGACKGWETMTTATIVMKEGEMLDKPLTKTVNHKRLAFILPYKEGHMRCYINTWDGMRRPDVYITNTQICSKYDATTFIRRIQNVSEDGFDNMIIWK